MSRRQIDWAQVVEQAAVRAIREALLEATAAHWRRRAAQFRAVGTPECDEIAQACENRARVSLFGGDLAEIGATLNDVLAELGEAS
jgi:hypothetical protein